MESSAEALIPEIRERVAALGYELVDVRKRRTGKRLSLQVRIDRAQSQAERGVTADDCARASRGIEVWLDDTGVLGTGYVLEVSSPGLERPIKWPEHWRRYVGSDVRVKLPDHGRARATILGVPDDETVSLRLENGREVSVPIQQAKDATLVVDWSQVDRSLSRTASKEKA